MLCVEAGTAPAALEICQLKAMVTGWAEGATVRSVPFALSVTGVDGRVAADGVRVTVCTLPSLHVMASACAQAAHAARFPLRGDGWQECDGGGSGLHEHFGHAGAAAEVSVDLERGVGVEQVGVCASATATVRTFV